MEVENTRYHLSNPTHPLSHALLERGIPLGVHFAVDHKAYLATKERLATLLELFPKALTHSMIEHEFDRPVMIHIGGSRQSNDGRQAIVIEFDKNDAAFHPEDVNISITHMLSTGSAENERESIEDWFERATSGENEPLSGTGHYWCSAQDVAEALLRAFPFMTPGLQPYRIAGRRYWPPKDTWSEVKLLTERTLAGQSGHFQIKHLVDDGGPSIEVLVLGGHDTRPLRPDITRFHELLEANTGEGWNPRTPLRQSLMLLLAEWTNR